MAKPKLVKRKFIKSVEGFSIPVMDGVEVTAKRPNLSPYYERGPGVFVRDEIKTPRTKPLRKKI